MEHQPVKPWLSHLPDERSLAGGITSVLATAGFAGATIIQRQRNPHASTFPSEAVTCRLNDGTELKLFCKYETGRDNRANGHRGGVAYEAEVYRRVLAPFELGVPRFYGAAPVGSGGETWLILGCVEPAVRLRDSHHIRDWERAASWSGRCHTQHLGADATSCFISRYAPDYYIGWARRTMQYAAAVKADFPWLEDLCRRCEPALAELAQVPQMVIHGEYYAKNLLISDGEVYPVDWESAAVAPGEIDLATLTDACEADVVARCERAYQVARWPAGAPPHFTRTLDLARLYVHLRWLGDDPGRKLRRRLWRYQVLRTLGERLRLL